MAAAKKDAADKVANVEYRDSGKTISNDAPADKAAAGAKSGTKAGDVAAKDYFVPLYDAEGKVTDKEPERGSLVVAKGQVISQAAADLIAGK